MAGHGLSKSRIAAWRQCPKRLWLQIHRPELLQLSSQAEETFQIGHEVGEVARGLYPDGILIRDDDDLAAALATTKTALSAHPERPIFEATFAHDGVLTRADMLLPAPGGYRMIEVKSSASVKPYHLDDCAIQAWVARQNGISLACVELAHIDTSFVYLGDGDYRGLFAHAPLDAEIVPLLSDVPAWIAGARETLSDVEPVITPGEQCGDPFVCPFKEYCAPSVPEARAPAYSLDIFHRMRSQKKDELREQGYEDALAVPPAHLTHTQLWIQRVSRKGTADLKNGAARQLARLPYPRYYLDFETISLAVPRWADTRPYVTQVPFQWSCHVEDAPGKLRHEMFLDVSGNDPRRVFAQALIATLAGTGPVIVYNQSFEKSRIRELAALHPDLAAALHAINARVVDLLPIAQEHYYHPDMKGSWSIKAVLPTVAPDISYAALAVGDGMEAQSAFREILHPATSAQRRHDLIESLRQYCALDTLAMVRIAWFFQGLPDGEGRKNVA